MLIFLQRTSVYENKQMTYFITLKRQVHVLSVVKRIRQPQVTITKYLEVIKSTKKRNCVLFRICNFRPAASNRLVVNGNSRNSPLTNQDDTQRDRLIAPLEHTQQPKDLT